MSSLHHGLPRLPADGAGRWKAGSRRPAIAGLLAAFLIVPTLAVVLEGYTGLIYTLEIAVGLGVLMALSVRPELRAVLAELVGATEENHAA